MLKRSTKALFYAAAGPLMKANGAMYRAFRAPNDGALRIHLGPGQNKYIDQWVNVDANAFTGKCDVWADLRNPLPFRANTVSAAYSHHVIEHLPDRHSHLKDVYRVLKPGGVYRVAGPNGDTAVRQLIHGNKDWFGSWPDDRRSIGGRFENYIFCRGEHLTILFEDFLRELLEDAGFTDIQKAIAGQTTGYGDLFSDVLPFENEPTPDQPRNIVLEAVKR